MDCILAIDQSTSATKALLFSPEGRVISSEVVEHAQIYPQPGWVEHDPEGLWRNTLDAARGALAAAPQAVPRVGCVSVSNQRETVVPFSRRTGRPLHNALVWQDRRGDALCARLIADGHEAEVRAISGLTIDGYFTASKASWLLQNVDAVRAAAASGDLCLGTVDAWLVYRMTRGAACATDVTNASRTLLLDIASLAWSPAMLARFGVPAEALPDVRACSDVFGETDLEGLLPGPVPVCGVMGDQQAALLAEGCLQPGQAKATFGTGCFILVNTGSRAMAAPAGLVTTAAWRLRDTTCYAFEGAIQSAGSTVTWLRDQLGLIQAAGETEALAAQVSDNGGVYLVPAFTGLGAPYWQPSARAALVGLTQHSDRRHVARAALEAVAYQVRDVLAGIAEAGAPLTEVRADGGMVRNALLMQFVADITRLPVRASRFADLTPLGAAVAGRCGLSGLSLSEIAPAVADSVDYAPNVPAAAAERLYAGWQAAVRRVL